MESGCRSISARRAARRSRGRSSARRRTSSSTTAGTTRCIHYAGPTWESNDGSSVQGAKVAAATVDPTAVPWLLLTASAHGATDGRFSDVTSIQRMETVGGVAPATGCDAAHVNALAEIPYSAHYFFYETKAHGHVDQCGG